MQLTMETVRKTVDMLREADGRSYEDKAIILPTSLAGRRGMLEKEFPGLEIIVNSLVPEGQVYIVNKVQLERIMEQA